MKSIRKKSILIVLMVVIAAMIPIGVYAASNTLKKPTIKSVSVSGRQVTVKYGKVKKAKKYIVYSVKKKKNKNVYTKIAISKTTTARFMGKYNTRYKLVVRAFNGKKKSKYSAVKSKKIGASNTYVFFGSDSRWNGDGWENVKTSGNRGTNGEPRSDVIMLIKVNPGNKTVDLVSVYRDTLVNIANSGTNLEKVNRAYAKYGPAGAVSVLEKNLDIQIDGYIVANFKGVADAIDEMGGVRYKIENDKVEDSWRAQYGYKTIPDVMNSYIDGHNTIYGENTKHIDNSYSQSAKVLTGSQAVAYARVRYTDGGDLRRAKRQRSILSAMISKFQSIKSKDKARSQRILKSIYPTIDTDLSEIQLLALLNKVSNYKIRKEIGYPIYKSSGYIKLKEEYQTNGREYVIIPNDTTSNVKELHKKLYGESIYKASKKVRSNNKAIGKASIYDRETGGVKRSTSYKYRNKNWDRIYDR